MRNLTAGLLMLGLVALSAPAAAQSYRMSGFGGKVGYATPEDLDGTLTIGGHLDFERAGSRVHVLPSLMYWRVNDVSDLNPNLDLSYHFEPEGAVSPYLGAGLGVNRVWDDRENRSSDSKLGGNVFGGLRFPAVTSHAFAEGRYTMTEMSQFAVLGGITFHNH